MIPLDRSRVPIPPELNGPLSAGGIEMTAAVKFFATRANASKPFPDGFKAYGSSGVRQALELLSYNKCAYCESSYAATQPVAVEHFRPKGFILVSAKPRRIKRPGYYWLAAEWTNLLPSCTDCNSPRGHEFPTGKRTLGKANLFPLADEKKRAARAAQLAREAPLLIDPTLVNPSAHLTFLPNGAVQAVEDAAGQPSAIGVASIEGYALARPRLCQAREERAKLVQNQVERVKDCLEDRAENPGVAKFEKRLAKELEELKRMVGPDQPYSAMARRLAAETLHL